MEQILVRLTKPLFFGVVMFIALIWLSGSARIAFAGMLIPLVLGWLGMYTDFAYRLTALAMVVAVVFAILPSRIKDDLSQAYAQMVSSEGPHPAPAPPAPPIPAQPANRTPPAAN